MKQIRKQHSGQPTRYSIAVRPKACGTVAIVRGFGAQLGTRPLWIRKADIIETYKFPVVIVVAMLFLLLFVICCCSCCCFFSIVVVVVVCDLLLFCCCMRVSACVCA